MKSFWRDRDRLQHCYYINARGQRSQLHAWPCFVHRDVNIGQTYMVQTVPDFILWHLNSLFLLGGGQIDLCTRYGTKVPGDPEWPRLQHSHHVWRPLTLQWFQLHMCWMTTEHHTHSMKNYTVYDKWHKCPNIVYEYCNCIVLWIALVTQCHKRCSFD